MIRDAKKEIISALNQLTHVGVITDEAMVAIAGIVSNEMNAWKSDIAEELDTQVKNWEESQGFEDDTLYTLGLRRAKDLVVGKDFTTQLPVLETPETLLDDGEDG